MVGARFRVHLPIMQENATLFDRLHTTRELPYSSPLTAFGPSCCPKFSNFRFGYFSISWTMLLYALVFMSLSTGICMSQMSTTTPINSIRNQFPIFSWGSDNNSPIQLTDSEKHLSFLIGKEFSELIGTSDAMAARISVDKDETKAFMESIRGKSQIDITGKTTVDGSRPLATYLVWGRPTAGGSVDEKAYSILKPDDESETVKRASDGYHVIQANDVCPLADAFVAIRDGTLVCWGNARTCTGWDTVIGDSRPLRVTQVYCSGKLGRMALVLLNDEHPEYHGYLSIMGDPEAGGTFPTEPSSIRDIMGGVRESGIIQVVANDGAVAVLMPGGQAVIWGKEDFGGSPPKEIQLNFISKLYVNPIGFAGLKTTGKIVSWGKFGQDYIPERIRLNSADKVLEVEDVITTPKCFAALTKTGGVATWGEGEELFCNEEGASNSVNYVSYRFVASKLIDGVLRVVGNDDAFCAIKANNEIITWGKKKSGGNKPIASSQEYPQPDSLVATARAFGFSRKDGGVVVWGDEDYGGTFIPQYQKYTGWRLAATRMEFLFIEDDDGGIIQWMGSNNGFYISNSDVYDFRTPGKATHLFRTDAASAALFGRNCTLGEFGEWSSCSTECDGGTRHRTRTIAQESYMGYCDVDAHLEESEPCNTQACTQKPWSFDSSSLSTGPIIAVAAGGLGVAALGLWGCCVCCRRRRTSEFDYL